MIQQTSLRERSGEVTSPDKLVSFLYTLMRDHLPAGVVEKILVEDVERCAGKTIEYSNGYLASYAQDVANRLR